MNTIQSGVGSLGTDALLQRPSAAGQEPGGSFTAALGDAVKRVDDLQAKADQQVSDLLQGRGADLHSTLIAVEKADLSFQLMMQVRNKIVSAYEEIARMQF